MTQWGPGTGPAGGSAQPPATVRVGLWPGAVYDLVPTCPRSSRGPWGHSDHRRPHRPSDCKSSGRRAPGLVLPAVSRPQTPRGRTGGGANSDGCDDVGGPFWEPRGLFGQWIPSPNLARVCVRDFLLSDNSRPPAHMRSLLLGLMDEARCCWRPIRSSPKAPRFLEC